MSPRVGRHWFTGNAKEFSRPEYKSARQNGRAVDPEGCKHFHSFRSFFSSLCLFSVFLTLCPSLSIFPFLSRSFYFITLRRLSAGHPDGLGALSTGRAGVFGPGTRWSDRKRTFLGVGQDDIFTRLEKRP